MVLAAGASREFRYRHPLPDGEELGNLALIAVAASRHSLIMSISRVLAWGALIHDLVNRLHAVDYVRRQWQSLIAAGSSYVAL